MKKIAVILAGCGHLDGSEIREAVLTLLEIDRNGAEAHIFAPDIKQHHVINHMNGKEIAQERNVLVEAARIARGKIKPLSELNVSEFDALIMPGGFGAAKNLATVAFDGAKGSVNGMVKEVIDSFVKSEKPVGSICISPAIVAIALKSQNPKLTLGNESNMLEEIGVQSSKCATEDIVFDEKLKLVSTPAYMHNDRLSKVSDGIAKLVKKVLEIS